MSTPAAVLDFPALAQAALPHAERLLREWFPEGKRTGHEFKIGNLSGNKGDSLSVNINTGRWSDFAADESGGDLISLYAAIHRISQGEAARKLSEEIGFSGNGHQPPAPAKDEPPAIPIIPVPDDVVSINAFKHPVHGKPSRLWAYRDRAGRLLGYQARFDFKKDGQPDKAVFPVLWASKAEKRPWWRCVGFPQPLPLYNADLIAQRPDAPIIICEGCKAADAAAELSSKAVVTTWPAGAASVLLADWSPLHGRDVIFWPDADPEGLDAMARLAEVLEGKVKNVLSFKPPEGVVKGWDAADALAEGWTREKIVARLRKPGEWTPPKREAEEEEPEEDGGDDLPVAYSEDALAHIFSERHADDLRYVPEWSAWLSWTGHTWKKDSTLCVFDFIRAVTREKSRELAAFLRAEGKSLASARKLASAQVVAAVERLARSDSRHVVPAERLDADPLLLGTPGGIVDLRTGKLRPGEREDYIAKSTLVTPSGDCPQWRACLADWTGGDGDLAAYLRRLPGYSTTGITREHCAFFLYGPARAGKTSFTETTARVLGDYATTAPIELLTPDAREHPTMIAGLAGARLVLMSETEEGRFFAESRFKRLVGGDKMSARYMRADYFTFSPQCKLLFHGNHRPRLKTTDESMKRRLHVIPFTQPVPVEAVEKGLVDRLVAEEGPGILAWAIQGCLEWQREGLNPPLAVTGAVDKYFAAEDAFGRWLEENCVEGNQHTATSKALWNSWKVWAEDHGEAVLYQRWLSQRLEAKGFIPDRFKGGAHGFREVGLISNPEGVLKDVE